jgi:hypothetical protein
MGKFRPILIIATGNSITGSFQGGILTSMMAGGTLRSKSDIATPVRSHATEKSITDFTEIFAIGKQDLCDVKLSPRLSCR